MCINGWKGWILLREEGCDLWNHHTYIHYTIKTNIPFPKHDDVVNDMFKNLESPNFKCCQIL